MNVSRRVNDTNLSFLNDSHDDATSSMVGSMTCAVTDRTMSVGAATIARRSILSLDVLVALNDAHEGDFTVAVTEIDLWLRA
jgi:hypothetical protein